jgi:hypothetical protein
MNTPDLIELSIGIGSFVFPVCTLLIIRSIVRKRSLSDHDDVDDPDDLIGDEWKEVHGD